MKLVSLTHRFISIVLTENQKCFLRNNLHIRVFRNSIALWRFNKVYHSLSEKERNKMRYIFNRVRLRSGNSDIVELSFEINLNSAMCELYGLLTGDGSVLRVCRFYNTNKVLVKKFDELLYNTFKVKTRQEETKNHHYVPKVVQIVLESFFGRKGLSKTANVPSLMFNLESEFVKPYLRGLFDTDGCSCHEPPKLTSSSLKLLKGVKKLLFIKFNITSRIRCNRKNDYDLIMGNGDKHSVFFNTLIFYENINFNHPRKKKLLENKIVNRTLYKTLNLVKEGCNDSSEIRDKLGISWTGTLEHLNKLEEFGLINRIKTNEGNKHIWLVDKTRRKI